MTEEELLLLAKLIGSRVQSGKLPEQDETGHYILDDPIGTLIKK